MKIIIKQWQIDEYLQDENSEKIRLVKNKIKSKLNNEHNYLKKKKNLAIKKRYKYEKRNTSLKNIVLDEDNIYNIYDLLEELKISKKRYLKILNILENNEVKHLYSLLKTTDFLSLLIIVVKLYKYSFSSKDIALFLLNKITRDTILKYIDIWHVKKNLKDIRIKPYQIHFTKRPEVYDIESIGQVRFGIYYKDENFYLLKGESAYGGYSDIYSYILKKFTDTDIYKIKNSRIYKKIKTRTLP